jgi:hypothetical protein
MLLRFEFGCDFDISALLTQMSLDASLLPPSPSITPSNPSCFFLSLSSLPSQSPCETLSKSDGMRIQVAVKMALCEIKTAFDDEGRNGRVPKECSDWKGAKEGVSNCVE